MLLLAIAGPGACVRSESDVDPRFAAAAVAALRQPSEATAYRCGAGLAPDATASAARLRSDYLRWRGRYVVSFGRKGMLRVDAGEEYDGGTPSEAIGYGMLLAAYLDDRPTFDGLWTFARSFRNPRGLMAWSISRDGTILDSNAATDGDEDMAFALLVAEARWGGYDGYARELLDILLRHGVEAGTDLFKPGDVVGGSGLTNPSYFAPAYYKLFAAYSGEPRWLRVADASYGILERVARAHSPSAGLVPEWATAAGDSVPDPFGFPFHFGYNATRTAWRLAMDAAWNCDPRARRHLGLMNEFYRRIGPENLVDGYTLDGRPLGRYHNAAFVGPAAAAAVVAEDSTYRRSVWDEAVVLEPSNYYNDSLRLLTLLFASGSMLPPGVP